MTSQQYLRSSWRKSSYSGSDGTSCVEVATLWRKSSHSGGGGAECVEIAALTGHGVVLRDSKDPDGPTLSVAPTAWTSLLTDIKGGSLDLTP